MKPDHKPIPVTYGPPVSYYTQRHGAMLVNTIILDLGGVLMRHNIQGCIDAFRELTNDESLHTVLGFSGKCEGKENSLMARYEKGEVTTRMFLDAILPHCKPGTTDGDVIAAWDMVHGGVPDEMWEKVELLKKRGYKLYMLSNNNELHWQHIMDNYQERIETLFDGVFLSHVMHCAKPDPIIFMRVARETNTIGERSVYYVDDLEANRLAARRSAGWNTCGSIDELLKKINA